jgi:hypothetical protein
MPADGKKGNNEIKDTVNWVLPGNNHDSAKHCHYTQEPEKYLRRIHKSVAGNKENVLECVSKPACFDAGLKVKSEK